MRSQIEAFCNFYEYPAEATASLLSDYDKIMNSEYATLFQRHVDLYNSDDPLFSYDAVLSVSKNHITHAGVSSYAVDLLFFICFAEHCKQKYEKAGLPMTFYHRSMLDLKWKLDVSDKV